MKFKIMFLTLALVLSGCSRTFFMGHYSQSHFDFPNSNIKPLGHVKGEASKTSFLTDPQLDSSLDKAVIDNALAQKPGADILLNYMKFWTTTSILGFTTYTYSVEGTAASMEIGTQGLK